MKHVVDNMIRTGTATVVDVRTEEEFNDDHLEGSINIPLQELPSRLNELEEKKNIVLCCASGARSAMATKYLMQQNISCMNGGPWTNFKFKKIC